MANATGKIRRGQASEALRFVGFLVPMFPPRLIRLIAVDLAWLLTRVRMVLLAFIFARAPDR
jgi:hypothetical protein